MAFSIIWGIVGVLFVNYIHPFIEKKVNKLLLKIPIITQKITLVFLIIILIVDEILSVGDIKFQEKNKEKSATIKIIITILFLSKLALFSTLTDFTTTSNNLS